MTPMRCTRCLYTTAHPFGLTLDAEGVCSGCRTHEEKTTLDWAARRDSLKARLPGWLGKRRDRADHDCVLPVRGTPEHFKLVDIVKNELGLNPLVVVYNSQFNSAVGIENLDRLRDTFDVDLLHYTSNPIVYRKLIRETLPRMHSMRWPLLAGMTQFPVQVAAERNIPLVIWPTHQPTEQAGTHSYTEEAEMSRRGRHEYDLMGVEPQDLVTVESLLSPGDVEDLEYPDNPLLRRTGVRGIYLGNYYPWDARRYAEEMMARHGARAARNRRTFDTHDRIDDATYMTAHDLLKQAKLGYSRVTDSLCREIRFGRVTREDALAIEQHYQAQMPSAEIDQFCRWLGMERVGFDWLLQQARPGFALPAPTELTARQQAFVDGFEATAEPVWRTEKYIVYGKGLVV